MTPDAWRGTSDARATIAARAATTPGERLRWLEESLLLAEASGALARVRARRHQQEMAAWAATEPQSAG